MCIRDRINVKYGSAFISKTKFVGNRKPDTDGIDYDQIYDGEIINCEFNDFLGFNSDGIDIGEGCKHIEIDSVIIYNIADKGISVGQKSSVNIKNALIFNTGIGVAVKDSSWAVITNSTFYNNRKGVASYEKNPGIGGGNIVVNYCIISNAVNTSFFVDKFSNFDISNSISDTNLMPGTDSSQDIGTTGIRWANGYFDNLYGDGSNITNVGSGSVSAPGSDHQVIFNNGGSSFGAASVLYWNDTCLLYTSPSPRDRQKSRMPSSA